MRIWHPIPPICLDDKRLLGEHRELHAIWNILTQNKKGYRNHPEVKRWKGHMLALFVRHVLQVTEMERRGWKHASTLRADRCDPGLGKWPEPWEPVEVMREKLAEKIEGSMER